VMSMPHISERDMLQTRQQRGATTRERHITACTLDAARV
jgi:hypothetical protein